MAPPATRVRPQTTAWQGSRGRRGNPAPGSSGLVANPAMHHVGVAGNSHRSEMVRNLVQGFLAAAVRLYRCFAVRVAAQTTKNSGGLRLSEPFHGQPCEAAEAPIRAPPGRAECCDDSASPGPES